MSTPHFLLDKYSRAIYTVLVLNASFDGDHAMRFNELERKVKEYGFKMSTPTFVLKIKELVKLKAIRKVVRGRQNIGYFVTQEYIEPSEILKEWNWVNKSREIIKTWSLKEVASYVIRLLLLRDFFLLKLMLRHRFEPQPEKITNLQLDIIMAGFEYIINITLGATEGKEEEYVETMKHLDNQMRKCHEVLHTNK